MGDLLHDVTAYLHSQTMLEQIRISGYMEVIMDDSWVRDFSKAWGNERNGDPPRSLVEETEAFIKAEKDASVVTSISPSLYIVSDTESPTVQVWTGRGTAEIAKSDIPALIAALSPLAQPYYTPTDGYQGGTASYMPPKQAYTPTQQVLQKRNDENLEFAIKQANKRFYGR